MTVFECSGSPSVFFLDGWRDWLTGPHESLSDDLRPSLKNFISSELYRDVTLSAVGLTMTVFMHEIFLPGCPLDVSLLGSDACEHYFGVIRSYVKYKSSPCIAEACNILTRVVGDIKERSRGDIAFPQMGEHGSRTTRTAMLEALAKLKSEMGRVTSQCMQGSMDPTNVACALNAAIMLAEQAAASELNTCGIMYVSPGLTTVRYSLPAHGDVQAAASPADPTAEDAFMESLFANDDNNEDSPLSCVDYLIELHETWLHNMEQNDVDAAVETLLEARESMCGLKGEAVAAELKEMAIGEVQESAGICRAPSGGTERANTGTARGTATTETTPSVTAGNELRAAAIGGTSQTKPKSKQVEAQIAVSDLMVDWHGSKVHLSYVVAEEDGRVHVGPANRRERFWMTARECFTYQPAEQLGPATDGTVSLCELVIGWLPGKTDAKTDDHMPGRYVLGRVDGIYLKPTAKSAFPKETWLLKAKGDVILRLTLFDPKDPLGQDCSVVDAETFTRRPSAQAITHVAIHNFVVKAATGAGESAAGARLTISKDQQTWLDNNYPALVARDVQALEREKATRDEARAKQAAARQDGPIQKMQKGDLYKKIKEVFFELPENWNKFKRPELRDVTACVFESIQGQLPAGAAALDTRGLHQALVDLSDRDATSPPIEARSEAFVQAVRAAQLALAPDAVGASSFREGPAYSDAHVHSVILQAVILPCLERIVHSLTHSIGIELLSIFFLGVFAIALRRRCMAGAGSNMLRVHAYVKLLAVTTWIMAIWPFLSSWSGSFILWFNIGFEIPRPTLTSTLLQLVVTGTAWVVRSEVVLAVAHSTVLVLLSGIGAVPVLSREILLWRAAYLASLGACLWVMRAGARHLLWCILGSQGAKHAALASCGVAGKPC